MPIVLRLYGSTTQIKDIKDQAKVSKGGKKNQKTASWLPLFIGLC